MVPVCCTRHPYPKQGITSTHTTTHRACCVRGRSSSTHKCDGSSTTTIKTTTAAPQQQRHSSRGGGVRVVSSDAECPLQVCQLSRSSESTHFLRLSRDAALFGSTRAPDGFCDPRYVPPTYFLTIPNINANLIIRTSSKLLQFG